MSSTTDFQEKVVSKILSGDSDEFRIDLTPSDAALLLQLNQSNRSARPKLTQTYADDMINGRWSYAGDPIRFNLDGILVDGQHRLSALASLRDKPDFSLNFLLVTGLDRKSQSVMDQGAKRTTADNLAILGIKSPKDVAASARIYIQWTTGTMFSGKWVVGSVEIQEWINDNPEFIEICNRVVKYKKDIDLQPSTYISAYAAFSKIDQGDADDFIHMWATGINLHAGHPVLTLRDKLARIRRERINVTHRDNLANVILAWNAYRENRALVRFTRPKEGAWTKENFPQPI